MPRQILFYLYSTQNIVGSALGLLGLLLFFFGIIKSFWLLIVIGLYLVGVIGVPRNKAFHLELNREADAAKIEDALKTLLQHLKKDVSKPVFEKVESIVQSIQAVLPEIMQLQPSDPAAYTIRQTALNYLPETLENYLKLPRAYARFHELHDGKTARDILLEQLTILDKEMQEIVADIHGKNIDNLRVHGRFLQSRFAQSDKFWN